MYIGFVFLPVVLALVLSFVDYNLILDPVFVGFENITRLFRDSLTITSFRNTFRFLAILVPIHVGLGLILAYLVYKARRFQFFFRTAIYFPVVVTTAAVAIAWGFLFATDLGAINFFVRSLGGSNIPWLTNSTMVYVTIAIFSFWKFIGTTFLYYFIGLQNIPEGYYEAARIDGSGSLHTFFHITIPMLSPTIFFVMVTNIVGVFQIFDEPFLLTEGGPGAATRTVVLQIYDIAFRQMNIGYGAAISLMLFIIILVITIIQYIGQNKWVVYDYE
jgi:multiple sugar transport system permease protein